MTVDTSTATACEIPPQNRLKRSISVDARAKARAARAAQHEWALENLRRDFLDDPNWTELARVRGVRLPRWSNPRTPGSMRRWLRKLGLSVDWYRDQNGYRTLGEWIKANPRWPLRTFVGLCLEEHERGGE